MYDLSFKEIDKELIGRLEEMGFVVTIVDNSFSETTVAHYYKINGRRCFGYLYTKSDGSTGRKQAYVFPPYSQEHLFAIEVENRKTAKEKKILIDKLGETLEEKYDNLARIIAFSAANGSRVPELQPKDALARQMKPQTASDKPKDVSVPVEPKPKECKGEEIKTPPSVANHNQAVADESTQNEIVSNVPTSSQEQDRLETSRDSAIQLFNYLFELVRQRTRVIRTVDEFDEVIWFSDIPKEKECYHPLWAESPNLSDENWLVIQKPVFAKPPLLPPELIDWVLESELVNSETLPQIRERVIDQNDKSIALTERPSVQTSWATYLKQWEKWAAENERLKRIQKVYAQLHKIHQSLRRLGESYELFLCFGLLAWEPPNAVPVKRHLIVAEAALELKPKTGALFLGPGVQGAKPSLECEMLPSSILPAGYEEQVKGLEECIWSTDKVSNVLSSWVHEISAEGKFLQQLKAEAKPTRIPVVTYAPAVVLRKRTQRTLLSVYQEIIKQLTSGGRLPSGVIKAVSFDGAKMEGPPDGSNETPKEWCEQILMPLHSNDDQTRIVERLQKSQGVLVQGPPGTGKSHTIANLICHLLANGKRVLVTSQTPRALKVLQGLLPEAVRPLCVALLGNDVFTLKSLENSVKGIVSKEHDWDPGRNRKRVVELRKKLEDLQKKEAKLRFDLRSIRERETFRHSLLDGKYQGTAQQIANLLRIQESEHGWLHVQIQFDMVSPLKNAEATELVGLHRELTPEKRQELSLLRLNTGELPGIESFVAQLKAEEGGKRICSAYSLIYGSDLCKILKSAPDEAMLALRDSLAEFSRRRKELGRFDYPWLATVMNHILADRDRQWKELHSTTSQLLPAMIETARKMEAWKVERPNEISRTRLLALAQGLHAHWAAGKWRGVAFVRPKVVKNATPVWKSCFVNGHMCDRPEHLSSLIQILELEEKLDRLWDHWAGIVKRPSGNTLHQVSLMADYCEPIAEALLLHDSMVAVTHAIETIPNLPKIHFGKAEEVEEYLQVIAAVQAEKQLWCARAILDSAADRTRTFAAQPNTHPVMAQIHRAINQRDEVEYAKLLEQLTTLDRMHEKESRLVQLHDRLASELPSTAKLIAENSSEGNWDIVLKEFEEAWNWSRVSTWLQELNRNTDQAVLCSALEVTAEALVQVKGELAAELAWGYCLSRMDEKLRAHLLAWANEIRLMGKEKGKYTETHRRAAAKNMEVCSRAIPAWIMPLYRVAETVKPAPGIFDIVIIDEASQSGPDALFLTYLAQKIVVVGDDQQISPSNIGLVREDGFALQTKYLKNFSSAHESALQVDSSFFQFAEILFHSRVVLREHFRCMPEIIQFSNDLCYSGTPLLPLRQYPPVRISPVKCTHVPEGHQEGTSSSSLNRPEAEALAQAVLACCLDPMYKGKTIGVISLLGEKQAAHIEQLLLSSIGPEEMESRNIVCGDAYAFQGDQRDVIFLSMVASPKETGMYALASNEHKKRFNVAASRARDQMWLFHTPSLSDFRNKDCLRYRLVEYCQSGGIRPLSNFDDTKLAAILAQAQAKRRENVPPPPPFDSWFEVDVFLKILSKGYRAIPQFHFAGYKIDIAIEGMNGRLAVECDGDAFHTEPDQIEHDEFRERVLERCGLRFWRVLGSVYYRNPDQALESLWQRLDEMGIEKAAGPSSESPRPAQEESPPKGSGDEPPPPPTQTRIEFIREKQYSEILQPNPAAKAPKVDTTQWNQLTLALETPATGNAPTQDRLSAALDWSKRSQLAGLRGHSAQTKIEVGTVVEYQSVRYRVTKVRNEGRGSIIYAANISDPNAPPKSFMPKLSGLLRIVNDTE